MSDDPDVRAAYEDFKAQSAERWDFAARPESEGRDGDHRRLHPTRVDPYATAEEQRNDLEQNHHLTIQSGLGGDHSGTMTQRRVRPVPSGPRRVQTRRDRIRFDRHGEYEAWLVHATMYRGQGRRAMSTEYHGVNSAMWTGAPVRRGPASLCCCPTSSVSRRGCEADKLGGYSDSYLFAALVFEGPDPQLRAELVSRGSCRRRPPWTTWMMWMTDRSPTRPTRSTG